MKKINIIRNIFSALITAGFSFLIFSCSPSRSQSDLLFPDQNPAAETETISYSVSPGITIHFTDPCSSSVDSVFINLINKQSENDRLDISIYGLNHEGVINSIEKAITRGVRVRFVGNLDGNEPLSQMKGDYYKGYHRIAAALDSKFPLEQKRVDYQAGISQFDDFRLANSQGIMHHKFMLTTESDGTKTVTTGSTNLTESGLNRNNNNLIVIKNNDVHMTYREHFEYLLRLPGADRIDTKRIHIVDGIPIDIIFSTQGKGGRGNSFRLVDGIMPADHLIDYIKNTVTSINFMIFSFSSTGISDILLTKQYEYLDVSGVLDHSQHLNSREEALSGSGINCRFDGNECTDGIHGGKLHHKVMILDYPLDEASVITGSFNWSQNSNEKNDEDILIIHSLRIAAVYMSEWQRVWEMGQDIIVDENGDSAAYQDIILNEIMWSGSRMNDGSSVPDDEFIEIKNQTERIINITGWRIEGAASGSNSLPLSGYIQPGEHLVVGKKKIQGSAFKPEYNLAAPELSLLNSSIHLTLYDTDDNIIDYAGDGSSGENFTGQDGTATFIRKSMARKIIPGDGRLKANWFRSNTQLNIDIGFDLYTMATPAADNILGKLKYKTLDLVISKIGWAGTNQSPSDEWIELYNNTDKDISLGGWSLIWNEDSIDNAGIVRIELYGIIRAHGSFLLERTDNESVPGISADLIYSGALRNRGENLVLSYNETEIIDNVNMESGWLFGNSSAGSRLSMKRNNLLMDGNSESSWITGDGDLP